MNRERLWLLVACSLLFAQFTAPQTVARGGGSSAAPDNHGLVLRLFIDPAPMEPSMYRDFMDFPRESQSSCLGSNPKLACTPLVLALENHGSRAVRSGLMTCGPRPISFQLQGEDGGWHELGRNQYGVCFRNFMVWHTILPGNRYAFSMRVADADPLNKSSFASSKTHTVRVVWNVLGCPAAEHPHPDSAPLPKGIGLYQWEAQCAGGAAAQPGYARLVSNPVTLKLPAAAQGSGKSVR